MVANSLAFLPKRGGLPSPSPWIWADFSDSLETYRKEHGDNTVTFEARSKEDLYLLLWSQNPPFLDASSQNPDTCCEIPRRHREAMGRYLSQGPRLAVSQQPVLTTTLDTAQSSLQPIPSQHLRLHERI